MERDSGLGILQNGFGSQQSNFISSWGGFVAWPAPSISQSNGCPIWDDCPDLLAVITSRAECQTPWIPNGL